MNDKDRLTMKTNVLDGYTLKCLCTFGRDMLADDEFGCNEYCEECGQDCRKCGIQEAFDRLAEYENTGLSPDEIKQLLPHTEQNDEPCEACIVAAGMKYGGESFKNCPMCGKPLKQYTCSEVLKITRDMAEIAKNSGMTIDEIEISLSSGNEAR